MNMRLISGIPYFQKLGWEGLALKLANLQTREFWYRRRGAYNPVKQHTYSMPDPVYTQELKYKIKALRDCSGARFARRKDTLQQYRRNRSINREEDIPLWSS